MAKLFNRAKMTTTTTGSGTITLGSASNGFQSFADAGVADGDVVQYVIEEGANFEIGTGTYSATGTSLTRTPSESSNSNNAITLAGQATVSITAVADDLNRLQHNGTDKVTVSSTGASVTGNISVTGTVDGRDIATDGAKLDSIESGATADQTKADIDALGIDAATLDGFDTTSSGDRWGVIPTVTADGVMEVGKYIDFHESDADTSDNSVRLYSNSGTLTSSGNVQVSGNIVVSGTVDGVDIAARDGVLTSTTTTANAALPKAGGTMTGALSMSGNVINDTLLGYHQLGAAQGGTSPYPYRYYRITSDLTFDDNRGYEVFIDGDDNHGYASLSHIWISSHNSSGNLDRVRMTYVSGEKRMLEVILASDEHVWIRSTQKWGQIRIRALYANEDVSAMPFATLEAEPSNAQFTEIEDFEWNGDNNTKTVEKNWHSNNDGSGSGLDADTLDGQHASAFLTDHPNISAASSSNNSGRTYIQDITVDDNGHVTGIATATETVTNTDTNTTYSLVASQSGGTNADPNLFLNGSSGTDYNVQLVGSGATTVTRNSNGQITISSTDTNTNTNQLTTFQLEDGDGTEVTISHGKEVKFVEGSNMDINWTDTSTGSDGDPYDLTFSVSSSPSFSGRVTFADGGYSIGNEYHTWKRSYVVNNTAPAELLYHDGNSLPNGGAYRFHAHIDGTGTDQSATAVYWNQNGTWKVNVTYQSGTSSNHPEFIIGGSPEKPQIHIDHTSNYTIQVLAERLELSEGTGTDNLAGFGTDAFLGSVNGTLRYNNAGGANSYNQGNVVFHDGYHPNADKWTTARTLSLTGGVTGSVSWDGSGNASMTSTVALATSSAVGGIKIGYTENGKNYPVELSNGQAYVNVPWTDTNTNTNQLTTFVVQDGDSTNVTISQGKYLKFAEGGAIDVNFTDTSTGSSGDPYDLTISHADTSSQASVNNSNGTVIQDVTLDTYGHVTGLTSYNLDGRYYTESEVNTFINRSYVSKHSASNLAAGWYTIAQNTGDRAVARFALWDTNSSDHQSVIFYASHHFGTDASNTLTVLDNSYFSGNPFRYIRIKDAGTYDGAALQVYIDDATNSVNIAIVGDDVQSSGWDIVDFLADATAPSQVSNWSNFGERSKIDLNQIAQGGLVTTGPIYADGDTTQYRVFNDNYHPNADKWTTARTHTVTLTGAVTGSASQSVDGTGNKTWTINTTQASTIFNWVLEDGDGTEVNITDGKEVKFVEGRGIDINWTDTSHGSDGDPYDLTFTGDSSKRGIARALGWIPAYGSATESNVFWDDAEEAVGLYSSSDTSIGMAFRAVRVTQGQRLRFTVPIKSSAADTDGLYVRLYYYTGDLPDGKFAVSNSATHTNVQEDTGGDTGWYENSSHTTSWRNFERSWTAPSTGYVSLVILNWSGFSGTVYAKQPDISLQDYDDLYVADQIIHTGDTDTYMQFHAANQWRVVTGGTERLEVNNDTMTVAATLSMNGHQIDMNNNDIVGVDQIVHEGDTNTYMQFHAADQWRVVVGGTERLEVKNSSPHVLVTGDLNSTSDARLKENVAPIENALSDITQLEGVSFDWKDTGTRGHGFIAQQVEPILPDVVQTDDETGIKSINYVGMIGHLVEAIKEQQTQIDALTAQVEELKR